MSRAVPWSVKGVDLDAQEAAREAARRSGMSVGDWLATVIGEHAAELGVDVDMMDDDERNDAVAARLGRLRSGRGTRRTDRGARRAYDDEDEAPRRRAPRAYRGETSWEEAEEPAARRPARTSPALLKMNRRLADLESRLEEEEEAKEIEAIDRKIETLNARLAAAAPPPPPRRAPMRRPLSDAVAQIAQRQADLDDIPRGLAARRVTRPAAPEPSAIAGLKGEIAHLAGVIGEMRRESAESVREQRAAPEEAAQVAALKREISTLVEAISTMRQDRPSPGNADVQTLRHQLTEMSRALGALAPRESVAALENAVRDLSQRVAHSRQDGVRESIVAPIESLIVDLKRSMANLGPGASIGALERRVESIGRNVEALAQAGADGETLSRIYEQTLDIRNLLSAAAARPMAADGLERQIADLGQRVERIAARGSSQAGLEAVAQSVADIRVAIERLDPSPLLRDLESRMDALSRKIDLAADASGADARFDDLAGRLDSLQRMLDKPRAAIDAAQLEAFARELSARSHQSVDTQGLARIVGEAARDATQANVAKLEATLRDLMLRIRPQADESATAARFDDLAGRLDALQRMLDKPRAAIDGAQLEAFAQDLSARSHQTIDTQGLARIVADAARDATQANIARLEDTLRDLPLRAGPQIDVEQVERIVRDASARHAPDTSRLEAMMRDIAARLDRPAPSSRVEVEKVQDMVRALATRVESAIVAGGPKALIPVEEQIEAIARKLDQPAQIAADTDRIERMILDLSARLDQPSSVTNHYVEQLQGTVRMLADRLEETARAGNPREALASLERQIADISRRLDAQAETTTARLEDLMRDVSQQFARAASSGDGAGRLQEAIEKLAQRLDEAGRAEASPQAFAALEEQVGRLAERLDAAGAPGALGGTLSEMSAQIERMREEAAQAAREAARQTARELAREEIAPGRAEGGDAGVRAMLTREISDLRALQDASDKRSHATLTAVHETLEKVVDRLAMLESDAEIDHRAPPAPARAPAPVQREPSPPRAPEPARAAPEEEDLLAVGSMPRFASAESHADEIAQSSPRFEAPAVPTVPSRAPQVQAPQPRPISELSAPVEHSIDDILMEPGSGKPTLRNSAPPPAASFDRAIEEARREEPEAEPRSAQASFIAAVRRAQKAAAEAAEEEENRLAATKGKSVGSKVTDALEEARARARAAAATHATRSGAQTSPEPEGGALGRARAFLNGRRRQILLSLAGLVLALGTLQVVRNFSAQPEGPAVERSVGQPAKPRNDQTSQAPSTTLSGEPNVMASTGFTRAPTASPPPDQFTMASGARVDPAPVSTIDAPQTQAALTPPRSGDLMGQAEAGDAAAQYELAARLSDGRSMARDMTAAAGWFEKSAAQNLAPAQYRLASLFEKGLGVQKDAARARDLYQRAAEQGHVKSMHNLAVLLADGASGKPDYAGAATWFHKAAEHGVRDSQYNLAILYARGLGTPQNFAQSYIWFTIAAAQGDEDAGKKRADVAGRLDPKQLAAARAAADAFKPKIADQKVNEVAEPAGGWDVKPARPANTNSPAASRPKISMR